MTVADAWGGEHHLRGPAAGVNDGGSVRAQLQKVRCVYEVVVVLPVVTLFSALAAVPEIVGRLELFLC